MRRLEPHRRILDLIRALPTVDTENRLMRVADRELSLSLIYMGEHERHTVLSRLGGTKAQRVREELTRHERTRIMYAQYEVAVRAVVTALEGHAATAPRSYYRPSRAASKRAR